MPNLIYFYLIGLASTVVVPVVAFVAYLTAHARGREYGRLRRRLPEATRYEDLQMRLADLQTQHDDMASEISAAHQTIDEADRQRKWLEDHRQEIEQMRVACDVTADGAWTLVLLVDDLLATGGTASAAARLVEQCGGDVLGLSFLVELADLGGRSRLDGRRVDALLTYE